MSFDVLGDLNWLAVIGATVAYFALGGIWYAPAVFDPQKPQAMAWVAVVGGYHIVGLVIASVVLSAWT